MTLKKAVILLSGGLDSATVLAIAREQGFACHALSMDYGQRHQAELNAATNPSAWHFHASDIPVIHREQVPGIQE